MACIFFNYFFLIVGLSVRTFDRLRTFEFNRLDVTDVKFASWKEYIMNYMTILF